MGLYDDMTQMELVQKLLEKDRQIRSIMEEKNSLEQVKLPWVSYLGTWQQQVAEDRFTYGRRLLEALGMPSDRTEALRGRGEVGESPTREFMLQRIHPSDLKGLVEKTAMLKQGSLAFYEMTYRIKNNQDKWKWFYERAILSLRDEAGAPLLITGYIFDVSEQKRIEQVLVSQNEQLAELSNLDYLTGLLNRIAFRERLGYEVKRIQRNTAPLCVIKLDIDHFRPINERHGTLVGDDIIVQIARILGPQVRSTDLVCRYDGEEFMLALMECTQEDGLAIAEKIRAEIETASFIMGIQVTVSGGLNQYSSGTVDMLIQGADQALREAKSRGRNQIVVASEPVSRP